MSGSMQYAYQVAMTVADPMWNSPGDESLKQSLGRRWDALSIRGRLPKVALAIIEAVIRPALIVKLAKIVKLAWPVIWRIVLLRALWEAM